MIFDNIKNCKMYYGIKPEFEKAFEFIRKVFEEKLEVGKYEIDGNRIFAFVQEYDSKLLENSVFEGHEKYIDIQCVVDGREMLGCLGASKAVVREKYSAEKDVAFYERSDLAAYCVAEQGDFCVFYPHDIHNPGLAFNDLPEKVKKIVVKIHV